MQHLTRVVSESGEVNTVFFARNRLGGFSFFDVKDLNGLVVTSSDYVVALVIKVQRGGIV
jgi:hypothetical protein